MKRIPLRLRGEIVAWAVIDDEDYALVRERRWSLHPGGYAMSGGAGRTVLMHRILLGLEKGDPLEGDHINRDKLDNRRANLRVVTREVNARNRGADSTSTSRFLGVSWCKQRKKWVASASSGGKRIPLGRFEREEDAAAAARKWRCEHTPYVYGIAA